MLRNDANVVLAAFKRAMRGYDRDAWAYGESVGVWSGWPSVKGWVANHSNPRSTCHVRSKDLGRAQRKRMALHQACDV